MKLTQLCLICAGGMLFAASGARAITITITPATVAQWTTNENSNLNASEVATLVGYEGTLTELYKQDVGAGSDSGGFAGSYSTTFANSASDPQDATITYTGGLSITSNALYLLVKDGSATPAQYAFDLRNLVINNAPYSWNGTDTLLLDGFWPGKGAISHVAIYGGNTATNVPEGGSALTLLGIAVSGLGFFRRFFRKV